jgi:hypothetical protein
VHFKVPNDFNNQRLGLCIDECLDNGLQQVSPSGKIWQVKKDKKNDKEAKYAKYCQMGQAARQLGKQLSK